MKRLISILVLLGAFSLWWFSPTQQIKRRARAFLSAVHIAPGSGDLARSMRGHKVAKYLAANVSVTGPESLSPELPPTVSREQVEASFAAVARWVKQISITHPKITVTRHQDRATVLMEMDAIVEFPQRRPIDGIVHATTEWQKDPQYGWVMERSEFTESPRR